MLLCLVAATTFWWLHAMNQPYSATIEYPLEVRYDQDKFVAVGRVASTIRVHLTAQGWTLMRRKFGYGLRTITVDIDREPKGGYVLGPSLFAEVNSALGGSQVSRMPDDTIWLEIEAYQTREVRLALDTSVLAVAPHFMVDGSARFTPRNITLKGPGSRLDSLGDTLWVRHQGQPLNASWDKKSIDLMAQVPALVVAAPQQVQASLPIAKYRLVSLKLRPRAQLEGFEGTGWPPKVEVSYRIREADWLEHGPKDFSLGVMWNDLAADSTLGLRLLRQPSTVFGVEWYPSRVPFPHE